jgi:hypothetical protein
VRLLSQGLQPVGAMVKALRDTYTHLYQGGALADLNARIASPQEMEELVSSARYRRWTSDFLC